jgi:quercetin dioxygenase-like cupin family protein
LKTASRDIDFECNRVQALNPNGTGAGLQSMASSAETPAVAALWSAADMALRIVRHADLAPCYNAFIDCRTPGSEAKENFTIIGPGVSENPAQYVHIAERHGVNIGGARQPPQCVNSQHSHDTAEVFVVHSGDWRFDLGEHGDDASVELHPGDVISLPVHMFRGFTNIGSDTGFLWAVLGGDDAGRVTWAPRVFEMARDYGLVLLENGRLVDAAAGEVIPAGLAPLAPTTRAEADAMRRATAATAAALASRSRAGRGETPIIGPGGHFADDHGFTLVRLDLPAGGAMPAGRVEGVEIIFVHRGSLAMAWDDNRMVLGEGDTLTVPTGLARTLAADSATTAFIVRGPAVR